MTSGPATMRAAQARGREQIEIGRLAIPEPAPGEVRVRLLACGICGSDLHFYHGGLWATGTTPGHEMAGEIDALGDGVLGLATGDRVAIEPLHTCGVCGDCLAGQPVRCRELRIHGIHCAGGLAEFVNVQASRAFRVPADLDPRVAALTEPMAVVVHGLRRGGLCAGGRVLVLGAGSIGLLAALAARELGAGEVFVTARHPHQAELASALGAARVLREPEADESGLQSLARDLPIDLVVETVGGRADTLRLAAQAIRPGGNVCVLGLFLGPITLDPLLLLLKEASLIWSNCYARAPGEPDFARAARLVASHRGRLAPLLTHRVPLDEVGRAFALASDKSAGAVKISVLP
jgi:2-desacetyl-2-hydroxyethyl bacteriochlorophyllide A dehydrogenase